MPGAPGRIRNVDCSALPPLAGPLGERFRRGGPACAPGPVAVKQRTLAGPLQQKGTEHQDDDQHNHCRRGIGNHFMLVRVHSSPPRQAFARAAMPDCDRPASSTILADSE